MKNRHNKPARLTQSFLTLLTILLAVPAAFAATVVWNAASGSDIGTAANWTGGVLPNPATPDTAQWNNTPSGALSLVYSSATLGGAAGNAGINLNMTAINTGALTIDSGVNTSSLRLGNVTLASGAGAFTLGDSLNTFNITLGGAASTQTWQNDSANTATINSDVVFGLGGGGAHTLALAGAGNWALNNVLANGSGTLTLTKSGTGTATLSAANTYTGTTTVSGGTLSVPTGGAIANTGGGFTVGSVANVNAVLSISGGSVSDSTTTGNAWAAYMQVGNGANMRGDVELTSGTLSVRRELNLGAGSGGYGAMTMSGGTMTVGSYMALGIGTGAYGVFNQSGGSATQNQTSAAGATLIGSGASCFGVMNVSGGTFNASAGGIFLPENNTCTGTLNISGTGAVTVGNASVGLKFGNSTSVSSGTLNLLGGTLTANLVQRNNNANVKGTFNFNGGTLKPSAASTTFMTGLSYAYVYGNGGTIDNNTYNITVGQPLLTPAGSGIIGVSGISVTTAGSGYINQPIVVISGGTSTADATAIANMVDDGTGAGTFKVGSYTITSPGVYTVAPTTVTLTGGGPVTAATSTSISTAANTSGGLTFQGSGTTTLSGASTYTGNTTISGGTLTIGTGGSLASPNISVASGATYDVSTAGGTLIANQNILGGGSVSGALTTDSTSTIIPGTDGTAGTLTFNNGLTMTAGSTFSYDLSVSHSSGNDKVVVTGTLALNSTVFNIKGPATLDTSDYMLATATTSITGGTPTMNWVTGFVPSNVGDFAVVNDGTAIKLHFLGAPTLTASVNPASAVRNQSVTITASATPGTIGNVASVTVDLTPIGGVNNAGLVYSNTVAGVEIWTNTFAVSAGTGAGSKSLTVTAANDSTPTPYTGSAFATLTVAAGTETWSGGGSGNWSDNADWVSGFAPGLVGDALIFTGSLNTSPNMDNSYTVTGLTFDSLASSFNIGTASSMLTNGSGGIVNNSTSAQTLSVPIVMNAAQTVNAAAGNITLGSTVNNGGNTVTVTGVSNSIVTGAISGTGGLTKAGNGAATLTGANAYTGTTTVSGGTLNLTGTSSMTGNMFANGGGTLTLAGTFGANANNGGFVAGNTAGTKGTINIPSGVTITRYNLFIGDASGIAGAVYQSGGSLTLSQAASVDNVRVGSSAGGLGYYNLSSGTLTANEVDIGGSLAGTFGVMDMTGGTITDSGWFILARGGTTSSGVFNMTGGSATAVRIENMWAATSGALSVFNIGGGSGTATFSTRGSTTLGLNLLNANIAGTISVANLITNGTLNVGIVKATGGANPTAVLNFNGGTLKSTTTTAGASFMTDANIDYVYVYGGGATIDNNGQAITISRPLSSPAGTGVTGLGVTTAGSGYIGAPLVAISGGTYTAPATASANMVDDGTGNGTYKVGSYTITSPGVYTVAPTTVTLTGGGPVTAATSTSISMAANATSGGLTFQGSSTTTLSGVNTYTGNTTISAGTLALSSSGSINSSANLSIAAGGTFDVSAISAYTLSSSTTLNAAGTASAATINGASGGTVSLGSQPIVLTYDGSHPALKISQGTLSLNGNAFTVNGAALASGGHTSYTIVTNAGGSISSAGIYTASGTAIGSRVGTITVSGATVKLNVDSAPVIANSVTNTVTPGSLWKISILSLSNAAAWSDPDGDSLTLSSVAPSALGTNVTSDANYIYYQGLVTTNDSFKYVISDGTLMATGAVYLVTAPATAPSISNPAVNGSGNPTFSGNGIPGYIYGVESETNLSGPWIEAGSVTVGGTGSWSFTDTNQVSPPAIFYRLYYPDNPGNPPQ